MRALVVVAAVVLAGCLADGPSDPDVPTEPTPLDVNGDQAIAETHDLLPAGLPQTSWTLDVDQGGILFATIRIEGRDAGLAVDPQACFRWERTYEGTRQSQGGGSCGGPNVNVAISINSLDMGGETLLHWDGDDRMPPGRYMFTVSAPPQANLLSVAFTVDNPEPASAEPEA